MSRSRTRTRRRNPLHDPQFTHLFKGGARIEVWDDGEVCVYDAVGQDQDDYFLQPGEVKRFREEILEAPLGRWHHFTKDMIRDDFALQGRTRKNPSSHRKGHHMSKSRRRTAYRKTKRWNPGKSRRGRRNPYARPNENDISTVRVTRGSRGRNCGRNPRRNPGTYTKHLSDGADVTVTGDGQVTVKGQGGRYSRYTIPHYRVSQMVRDIKHSRRGSFDMYSAESDSIHDAYPELASNPKRRGRKSRAHAKRGHRGHKLKSRGSRQDKRSTKRNRRKVSRLGHGRRRNPAQFPMPFMSAMNPKRRGKKRRNPKISRSEGKAMRRVLRRHGR